MVKHTLISRAAGQEGRPSIEAITVFGDRMPHFQDHRDAERGIRRAFEAAFGVAPVHVGSATLPFLASDEGDDDE